MTTGKDRTAPLGARTAAFLAYQNGKIGDFFARFTEVYKTQLRGIKARTRSVATDGDDIIQDIKVYLMCNLSRMSWNNKTHMIGAVRLIIKRHEANHYRNEKRRLRFLRELAVITQTRAEVSEYCLGDLLSFCRRFRERQPNAYRIYQLLLKGYHTREVAEKLGISANQVKTLRIRGQEYISRNWFQ